MSEDAARKMYLPGSLPRTVIESGDVEAMLWVQGEMALLHDEHTETAELMAIVCDRDNRWIIEYLNEVVKRTVAFKVVRAGDSSDYDHMPIVRPVGKLTPEDVAMHRIKSVIEMLNAHRQLGLVGKIPLQLSMPNRLDLALFLFVGRLQGQVLRHPYRTARGVWYTLRNLRKFKRAQQQEIGHIDAIDKDNVIVFNLESPAVLYALNIVPKVLRLPVAWLLAKQVAAVLNDLPLTGTVLHLCYGNLADTEVIQPGTTEEAVMFLRALGKLTSNRPKVHIPCAYGANPAPTNPEYYAALAKLPEDWHVIAGVVDENNPKASMEALEAFETALGRPAYGVATACGLGRHSEADAHAAVQLTGALAAYHNGTSHR